MSFTLSQRRRLAAAARRVAAAAYAPYSELHVGAAVLAGSGRIYTGANVENGSYGLTCCAERTAVFKAVSEGERRICAVAVHTPGLRPAPPCGACRQVLHEFGPQAAVLCTCRSRERLETTLDRLLPDAFGAPRPSRRHSGPDA